MVNESNHVTYVQTGWLHHDTLVEFKLYERAVHIWKRKHLGKDLFVKVTPVDVAMASQASFSMDLDESVDISETRARNKSWPLVNAAVSNITVNELRNGMGNFKPIFHKIFKALRSALPH